MYIDAGSGSMLLQAAAAGFFTILVFSRQILHWIKSRMVKSQPEEKHGEAN